MKALVQRVVSGSVSVNGEVVSSIGRGIVALIGIHRDDTRAEAEQIARKLAAVRLWEDEAGRRWARSAADLDYEILCVSQFTLYHTMKGNKPDFRQAMAGTESSQLYQEFLGLLRKSLGSEDKVKDGIFGAMMQVELINDGPVTVELEAPPKQKSPPSVSEASEAAT